jgi:hypothetical protein
VERGGERWREVERGGERWREVERGGERWREFTATSFAEATEGQEGAKDEKGRGVKSYWLFVIRYWRRS